MMSKKKKWEVWNKNRAEGLAKGWSNPNLCTKEMELGAGAKHWELIKKVHPLVEGKSVLDVGCGLGHLYALLKDVDYLGIDSSKAMIKKAYDFFPKDKNKFQFGSVYDLSNLSLFDTVVANGLVLHLPESEPVIIQLWGKTRICLVFTVWLGETPLLKKDKLFYQEAEKGKYLIRRRETMDDLQKIFDKLSGVYQIKKFPFCNPDPGSNMIFKLLRR